MNTDAPDLSLGEARVRVLGIQAKLHRWATADVGRRLDDLFNLVTEPAFLMVAWDRVRTNRGARTAGVDGATAYYIRSVRGEDVSLADLRADLKAGVFVPLPVRERMIPKSGGKLRRLGIPTVRDRVVQAAPRSCRSNRSSRRTSSRVRMASVRGVGRRTRSPRSSNSIPGGYRWALDAYCRVSVSPRRRGRTRPRCAASNCSASTSPAPTSPYIAAAYAAGRQRRADSDRDRYIAGFATAQEPKKLVLLAGGRFDAYVKGLRGVLAAGNRMVSEAPR